MIRAREIYTKIIRSAITYRIFTFHTPIEPYNTPKGIVKEIATTQIEYLRVVVGAYRYTPIYNFEIETFYPPLDLYFNKRVKAFEYRIVYSPEAEFVKSTYTWVAE